MQRQNSRGCSSAKCADRQPAHGCRSDVLLHQGAGSGDPSREQRQLHGDIRSETLLTVEVARVRMEYLAYLIERTGNRGMIEQLVQHSGRVRTLRRKDKGNAHRTVTSASTACSRDHRQTSDRPGSARVFLSTFASGCRLDCPFGFLLFTCKTAYIGRKAPRTISSRVRCSVFDESCNLLGSRGVNRVAAPTTSI